MFVVETYWLAIVLCVVTMLCWGSWANTQRLAGKSWRFELFYWDYVFGIVLLSILSAFTLGSMGTEGRKFLDDLSQVDWSYAIMPVLGGVVFNAANILLVAAIDIAGMSVAFPVGIGLALVIGVLKTYLRQPSGNPVVLFAGVGFVVLAIILDAMAYRRLPGQTKGMSTKGLVLSVACGVLMGFFYDLVIAGIAAEEDWASGATMGKLTPYTAVFLFSLGILASNLMFNTYIMARPFNGPPVGAADYFRGTLGQHLAGLVGGIIWAIGMALNFAASGKAGPAVSYGLGQGATMVAAIWGVFIWREFRAAPRGTGRLLAVMFAAFLVGLGLIIATKIETLASL